MSSHGPVTPLAQEIHRDKYRLPGESFEQSVERVASVLGEEANGHRERLTEMLLEQRFLPGGRIQASVGAGRDTTALNCFVSRTLEDSMSGIMQALTEAAETLRRGGGIGYDFSTLRPKGAPIKSLGSQASGPVSFMEMFNAMCGTIASAGHRRGAQMGILRVDHPDIFEFIEAKQTPGRLTNFNVSVAVTDAFMQAVEADESFCLRFGSTVHTIIKARDLWAAIMDATWDHAEPGVIFIDRLNEMNPLKAIEQIAATNPCGEQPLPPFGACLLGSFNLTKYVVENDQGWLDFHWRRFERDIPVAVRALDNVFEATSYALPEQREEALAKRRMGIGVCGLANAGEALGFGDYGSSEFNAFAEEVFWRLATGAYKASADLAKEKGPFPLFDPMTYGSAYHEQFTPGLQEHIAGGLRNATLISFAPTGTISMSADNVSGGIEPVFSHSYTRRVRMPDGERDEIVQDYGVRVFHTRGKTADECSLEDHLSVLALAQKWSDSGVSKTINVGDAVTREAFEQVYLEAWRRGAKGCTTFRAAGMREGVLKAAPHEGAACAIDPETGARSCA